MQNYQNLKLIPKLCNSCTSLFFHSSQTCLKKLGNNRLQLHGLSKKFKFNNTNQEDVRIFYRDYEKRTKLEGIVKFQKCREIPDETSIRRNNMAGKVFQQLVHSTLMASNCAAALQKYGVQFITATISRACATVIWSCTKEADAEKVNELLVSKIPVIRNAISTTRIVGSIPVIQFQQDTYSRELGKVHALLREISYGEDYAPRHLCESILNKNEVEPADYEAATSIDWDKIDALDSTAEEPMCSETGQWCSIKDGKFPKMKSSTLFGLNKEKLDFFVDEKVRLEMNDLFSYDRDTEEYDGSVAEKELKNWVKISKKELSKEAKRKLKTKQAHQDELDEQFWDSPQFEDERGQREYYYDGDDLA